MLTNTTELLALHGRAVRTTVELVNRVRHEDLVRRTPCADWSLAELLAHMTAQHHGFAAAARGRGDDPAAWRSRPLGNEPAARYAEAADEVLAAFAAPDVLGAEFALPDFGPGAKLPAAMAISAHFIDYVVHGWDVAHTLGLPYEPGEEIAKAALAIAERIPDGPERRQPDAPFRPALAVPDTAAPLDRVLLLLGRSPDWPS